MNNQDRKIVGYDPNTGVPIYENSSNPVTDNKDKTITGYDPNTGFPIYGEASGEVYIDSIKKIIKMNTIEKIILFIMYVAAIPSAFCGFLNTNGGIIAGIIIVLYVLISIIVFKNKIKKEEKNIINKNINNDSNKKSIIKYLIIFSLVAIMYFALYIYVGNQYNAYNVGGHGWDDEYGGGAGWFALLAFWPVYIFCLCTLSITSAIIINKIKRKMCEKILK